MLLGVPFSAIHDDEWLFHDYVNASARLIMLVRRTMCGAANARAGIVFVAKICHCKIRCFLSRKFANARSALALKDIWWSPLARQLIAAC